MPTENRSSNNESVRLPRDLVDLALAHLPNDSAAKWEIYELLGQPAQQQGEPAAWSRVKPNTPGAYWVRGNGLEQEALIQVIEDGGELRCNLHQRTTETDFGWGYAVSELNEDFEWLGPLYRHPAPVQGEPDGWQYRVSAGPATGWSLWNYGKGEQFKDNYKVETRPLFTHADPGEVERLRAEIKDLLHSSVKEEVFDVVCKERDTLRAQLAEANQTIDTLKAGGQLLVRDRDYLVKQLADRDGDVAEAHALLRDFCAHSALICGDLLRIAREDDCATTDPIRARAYAAMDHSRKVKKALSASAEPIPVSTLERIDQLKAKAQVNRTAELSSSAEPSAPVEIDERAKYLAWNNDMDCPLAGLGSPKDIAWRAWQARAALERKP